MVVMLVWFWAGFDKKTGAFLSQNPTQKNLTRTIQKPAQTSHHLLKHPDNKNQRL
jgi:hypothetical protein